ncbi:MAG: cell division protein ZapE [Alphaproteobacteria bacterium PRO2]|nr:cell division protein ZapE [Alphaproteobacteria bacterium PRO2]
MSKSPQIQYKDSLDKGKIKPDRAQEAALRSFQRLHEQLSEKPKNFIQKIAGSRRKESIKGIYIYGGVGRGKSMLMDLFYKSLPSTLKKRRVHFHEFMIEVHDYIHTRREDDDFDEGIDGVLPALAARIAERSKILCFDEFHVTDVADAMILGRLFTALFEWGVVVIATSNWPPDKLYEGGLQRDRFLPFIALLKSKMEVIHLDSPNDYRTMFLQSEGIYFWPLGDNSSARVKELFTKLTDGIAPREEILQVKGRDISVIAAKGVAWFTFSQLCEQPLGAEDYLKIAQSYRTVFLENVPKMAYDRRNEAKRLMTLIDALYENRTRLIVTADAPPDKLYYGHDHEFEFQRTVSRLLEMQSAEYLNNFL